MLPEQLSEAETLTQKGDYLSTVVLNVEKKRWMILLTFCLLNFSSAMSWITYAPILNQASIYYNVSTDWVLQCVNFFMYGYILPLIFGSWASYRYLKYTFITCIIINTAVGWIRYLSNTHIVYVLIAQTFGGIAQNFYLSCAPLIAERWFPSNERTLAVVIGTFANFLGWGFGFIFPSLLVDNTPNNIPTMLLFEAIIMSLPSIPGFLFIQDRPEVPANFSSIIKEQAEEKYLTACQNILNDLHLCASLLSFSISISYTVTSIIQILLPSSYSQFDIGMIGMTYLGVGIVGGFIGTIYIEFYSKNQVYDGLIKLLLMIGFISLIITAAFIPKLSLEYIYILCGFLGLGLVASSPFLIQSLIETSFPAQDTIPISIFYIFANLISTSANFLCSASSLEQYGLWILALILLPSGFYVMVWFRTQYKRRQAEFEVSITEK